MQNTWEKARGWLTAKSRKVRMKHLCLLAALVVLVAMVPVLAGGHYAHPEADDYTFSWRVHRLQEEGASFGELAAQAWSRTVSLYSDWQGSFVATFIMGMQPDAVFGTGAYALTAYMMMLSLTAGTLALCVVLLRRVLGVDGWTAGFVGLVVLFATLQFIHNPTETFYWYNGAVYYSFFHGLSLLYMACCLLFLTAKGKGGAVCALVAAMALGFLVGGANYVSCAYAIMAVGVIIVVAAVQKQKRWWGLLAPAAVLLGTFAVSVLAPGNQMRQARVEGREGFFRSIFNSFVTSIHYADEWGGLGVVLCMLLLVPVFWWLAPRVKLSFRWPALVSAASLCFYAAGFFPHLYAQNSSGPPRLLNVLCYWFLLVLAGNLFYWVGWARQRMAAGYKSAAGEPLGQAVAGYCRDRLLGGLVCFVVALGLTAALGYDKFTSWDAAYALYSGEAAAYRAEWQEREAILAANPGADVVVPELNHRPEPFYRNDITPLPEENANCARYYGVESVFTAPREAIEAGLASGEITQEMP